MAGDSQKRAQAKWLAANPSYMKEYMREWRRRNRQAIREYMDVWRHFNGGRIASYNQSYESAIKGQTPAWANTREINRVYLAAQERGLTVDHIVPLRGVKVCGLHVENNLRLVTHSNNASKGNKLIEELVA